MVQRPCLICGEPTEETRCPQHRAKRRLSARLAGYDSAWDRLSVRARRMQPFCTECGSSDDLQTDHSTDAWARHAAGLAIRLSDIRVLCGPHNRAAGQARPLREN